MLSFLYYQQDVYRNGLYEWHDGCLIRSRNCLPFSITWVHHRCLVGCMLLMFSILCFFFVCLCSVLPVFLDCSFLIAHSVFCNIYLFTVLFIYFKLRKGETLTFVQFQITWNLHIRNFVMRFVWISSHCYWFCFHYNYLWF
jgi:hypothetical protein